MPSNDQRFLRGGLTGGSGSGKSAVAAIFRDLGRVTLSADDIARSIMTSDPGVRADLVSLLGPETYGPDGSLNRGYVASLIFSKPGLKRKVDAIVHPPVITSIGVQISSLPPSRRAPYVIVEAALIFESGLDSEHDRVVVVDAPEEVRIARIIGRDKLSREDVLRRIGAQLPAAEKVELADLVIHNTGSLEDLRTRVVFVDSLLRRMVD